MKICKPGISTLEALTTRIGEEHLRERLLRQANHWAAEIHQGEGIFWLEKFISIDKLAEFALKATGLWQRAHNNIFRIETAQVIWELPRLPESFQRCGPLLSGLLW